MIKGLNSIIFLMLLILSLLSLGCYCAEVQEITNSKPLAVGQTLVSPGRIFELGFFSFSDSSKQYVGLWHKNIYPRKQVWVANRERPLAVSDGLASLIISRNGNLEIVDGKQNSVWSSNVTSQVSTSNTSSVVALLLDSGNFVVKNDVEADGVVWQSFDHPGDTMLPTQLLGFDSKSGKRNVLTSWKSENDPSVGRFWVGLSAETPSQVFVWVNNGSDSAPYWRSGPWDKSRFIGIPEMNSQYRSGFTLDDNVERGTKYLSWDRLLYPTYEEITSEGITKYMASVEGSNWTLGVEAPKHPCDIYGACGSFGVCKASESPICKCLKGFVPKSDQEWRKGNWTGGCVRKSKMFCQRQMTNRSVAAREKEDDGFLKMARLKVPDLHEFYVSFVSDTSENCKIRCLNNCSCLAYAFVNSIGCLVWSKDLIDIQQFSSGGVDVFIRVARAELGEGRPIKLIVSLTAICLISILGAIVFGFYRMRGHQRGKTTGNAGKYELADKIRTSRDTLREYIGKDDPYELLIYDFDSILVATDNFSLTNKLGQGGFGPVYKGKLPEGKEIAVKRLSSSSGQGKEEFKNETLLISNLQHKNLVRIMGCCVKGDEKLLVYEFMPNKSLDTFLFDPMRRAVLDWPCRFNIIQGVARGLLYLHHDSCLKVIHRDLKVSNILLDEKMNAKISDFGLARIVQETPDLENTKRVVGTIGYMSPEYAMGGIFSEKLDVYSFGVLVLEIISGKKNTSFCLHDQQQGFLAYAWNLWNEGKGLALVDEVLAGSYSSSEVMRCVHIGLLCVQDNAADRPTMLDVVFMLSSNIDGPQPKEPVFTVVYSTTPVIRPQPQYQSTFSTNDTSITAIEGR
ncbi:hypothetical protein ACLB2K_024243 [Fragaria x ananassa]